MSSSEIKRRPGGRSAAVRQSVLAATVDLVAEAGPAALTVGDVAHRAGVHETSIYRRWGTKERLLLDAMLDLSVTQIEFPDTGSLCGDLSAVAVSVTQFLTQDLGVALSKAMIVLDGEPPSAIDRAVFWQTRFERADHLFARASARGEWTEGVDHSDLIETLIARAYFRALFMHRPFNRREASEVVALLLDQTNTDSQ